MASNKLGKFKTYRQEYHRDCRRKDKWRGQVEARLESDRLEVEQEVNCLRINP